MKICEHKNTRMWEPHLAGARKCNDCGWVYNPNVGYVTGNPWYNEEAEIVESEKKELKRLKEKYESPTPEGEKAQDD